MAQSYKCTIEDCGDLASFESRQAALAAGWLFIEAVSHERVRYHVLCPKHGSVEWIRKACGTSKDKMK